MMSWQTVLRIGLISLFFLGLPGCLESKFELSSESRLPKWFVVPEGKTRADFTLAMEYYSNIDGSEAVFKLYDKEHYFCLDKIKTKISDRHIELKNPPKTAPKGYPLYLVVTINGVTEAIEHRKMEPTFYIVDDPAILKELGLNKSK